MSDAEYTVTDEEKLTSDTGDMNELSINPLLGAIEQIRTIIQNTPLDNSNNVKKIKSKSLIKKTSSKQNKLVDLSNINSEFKASYCNNFKSPIFHTLLNEIVKNVYIDPVTDKLRKDLSEQDKKSAKFTTIELRITDECDSSDPITINGKDVKMLFKRLFNGPGELKYGDKKYNISTTLPLNLVRQLMNDDLLVLAPNSSESVIRYTQAFKDMWNEAGISKNLPTESGTINEITHSKLIAALDKIKADSASAIYAAVASDYEDMVNILKIPYYVADGTMYVKVETLATAYSTAIKDSNIANVISAKYGSTEDGTKLSLSKIQKNILVQNF
jgi:hypothetical protein